MDAVIGDDDVATISKERLLDEEQHFLEQINPHGEPKHEGKRRKAWLQIPLRTRISARRLHRQFDHVPH
eukprot:8502993-Pyramimonas_sp.AAC.1